MVGSNVSSPTTVCKLCKKITQFYYFSIVCGVSQSKDDTDTIEIDTIKAKDV